MSVLEYENGLIGDVEEDEMPVYVADSTAEPLADHTVPGRSKGTVHNGLDFCVTKMLLLASSSWRDISASCKFINRSAMKARACYFINRYMSSCPISIPAMLMLYI